MSIQSPILISKFKKTYPNKTIAFEELILKNRVIILRGENGSGKSTILKAIMKLINHEGTIQNSNSVSYMPENPYFPQEVTVTDFLSKLSQENNIDYDYNSLLAKYRLKQKKNEMIHSLSKGMKAKVNLIQCLQRNVDVYLLDEPLSGLDEESVEILVKDINKSSKSAIYTVCFRIRKKKSFCHI